MTTNSQGQRGPLGFPHCLKIIKEHLQCENHPVKILMKQFNSAFLYKNRNFLYTEEGEPCPTPELRKFKSKTKN